MSKIGHNKPPRTINHKSISINKYEMKLLEEIRDHMQKKRDKHAPGESKVTIPMAISIMATSYWINELIPYYEMKKEGIDLYAI